MRMPSFLQSGFTCQGPPWQPTCSVPCLEVAVTAALTYDISSHRFGGDAQGANELRSAVHGCWAECRYTIRPMLTRGLMHGRIMLQSAISLTPVSAKIMSRRKSREQDVINPSPRFFNVGLCGRGTPFQNWTFFSQLVPLRRGPSTLKSRGAGLRLFARLFCFLDIIFADTGLAQLRLRVKLAVWRGITSATFFSYRVVYHFTRWLAFSAPNV